MPYTHIPNFKGIVALGAVAVAGLTPVLAQAQFQVNKLYGKTFPEVTQMFGKPLEATTGGPVTYSRFKTAGAVDTIVWYFPNTGRVGKVQITVLAKPGQTEQQVLKSYGLSLGANPMAFHLKPPATARASVGAVPGMPWTKVFIGHMYVVPSQKGAVQYCKEHHLDPYSTYFWMVQVSNKRPSDRMISAGDTGGTPAGGKPHRGKKGKGKGKG